MIILAHRGLWKDPREKNTGDALMAAMAAGFGIETDLRDHQGTVVVSHDPPLEGPHLSFDQLLDLRRASGCMAPLALNIKADGLHSAVTDTLTKREISHLQFFLFDMAVPDALGYLERSLPCFTRQSEVEPVPAFLESAAGVWVDCFQKDWIDSKTVLDHIAYGRRVALVSPELHGRSYREAWHRWKPLVQQLDESDQSDDLLLCTDHPEEARTFFQ